MPFDPNDWLTSMVTSLEAYVKTAIDESIVSPTGANSGLAVYEVVMEHLASADSAFVMPLDKTVIHFEIDDIDNQRVGYGPQIMESVIVEGDEINPGTVTDYEAWGHVVNFDVGIWSTDRSGGLTSRLKAYQLLDGLFNGDEAREALEDGTEGIEIRNYTSGRFVKESSNDIRLYRMVGGELVVRVYSRRATAPSVLVDGEITQDPQLIIDPNVPLVD